MTVARRRRPKPRGHFGATDDVLDEVFGGLSDPIRRAMLARLAHGECSVTSLSEPFAVSAPAISKHLRVLEKARLIDRRKAGRVHYCRLRADTLKRASDWIERQRAFWEQQFESLAQFLEHQDNAGRE